MTGDKLTVEQPEIVNGLQTSQEIFSHFQTRQAGSADSRNVMIRVIVPPDALTRNRITKATNSQTAVNPVMLHATDPIHFDIEERLRLHNLFYDRRKGEYRNLRKPVAQIVSIAALAQAVIAVVLRRPDDARARPGSMLKVENTYKQIFDENHNRDLFVTAILLDRQVISYLTAGSLSSDVRRDIRYYVDTWVCSELTGKDVPTAAEIVAVLQQTVQRIPNSVLDTARDAVLKLYQSLGGNDVVAKSPEFRSRLQKALAAKFSATTRP